MAGSRFEYVKLFENQERLLPGCWAVIRLDGRSFTKFAKVHNFTKPNDEHALRLCNAAAAMVLQSFDEHLAFAFGQSDEYSFILKRESTLFSRRHAKILSTIVSLFSSAYIALWPKFMTTSLCDIPSFDGRVVLYPTTKHLRDYMCWRQADVHINNLFNTTFWALIQLGGMSTQEAERLLKGTLSKDKHEILFSQFGINYNNELEMFRKGSLLANANKVTHTHLYSDASGGIFTKKSRGSGFALSTVPDNAGNQTEKKENELSDTTVVAIHEDIIGDQFWNQNPQILGHSDSDPPRIRKS